MNAMEYDMEMNSYQVQSHTVDFWTIFCIGKFQTGSRRRSHPFGYGGGSGSNFEEEEGGMFERRGGPVKRR